MRVVPQTGEATDEEIAARHQIAHDLASPVRGAVILADLLAETLEAPEPDLEVLREISKQLSELTLKSSEQLADFASERGE